MSQAQEVYFNREEIDLFRKSNNGHCEVEKGVDFSLPNSFETFETASFLQKVRLTRQFRKTLDTLRADSEQGDSGVCSVNASVNGELEEFLFSDDNGEERRETLQYYFSEWRALSDIRKSQMTKAEIFHRFGCLEKSLNVWKHFVSSAKEKRREEELRRDREREDSNMVKADWFREQRLVRHHLDRWRGLAKLMARKRQLRDLEKQKCQSRERINIFLRNLEEAVKETNKVVDKRQSKPPVQKDPAPNDVTKKSLKSKFTSTTLPSTASAKSKVSLKNKKMTEENKKSVSVAPKVEEKIVQEVLVESSEVQNDVIDISAVPAVIDLNILNEHTAFLKKSSDRRKYTEREVKALEKMMKQIKLGHSITDKHLYHRILRDNGNDEDENYEIGSTQTETTTTSNKRVAIFHSHEIRAGDVLQMRLQASLHDNEFATKSRHYETDCSVSKTQLKGGNRSKTPIRNIIVTKDSMPVKKADTEDPSEAKYFGKTEAYRTFQMHKSNPEEGFLERMKLRQKERERKRNEIRKFHQMRAEESRRLKAEEAALKERLEREEKERKKSELRSLKRKEKEKEKERELEKERQQTLHNVAMMWRRKNLLKNAFSAWNHHLANRRLKEYVAEKEWEKRALKNYFVKWMELKRRFESEKQKSAENFYNSRTILKHMRTWMGAAHVAIRKHQSAHDLYEFKLALRTFENWRSLSRQTHAREGKLIRKAVLFYKGLLVRRCWSNWGRFVNEKDAIRARDEMRKRLEEKVSLEVGDYMPSRLREV